MRRYMWEFGLAMVLWIAAIFLRRYGLAHGWIPVVATLLPALPLTLIVVAMLRVLVNLDELQRLIQLYAFAFSALLTGLITTVCGLLEGVIIAPVSIWIVWPLILGLWWLGMSIFSWHYRRTGRE